APDVTQCDLAIVDQLILIKQGLRGIYRQDEPCLVEEEARTKLMFSPSVIGVGLGVVLSLEVRANNNLVTDGNILSIHRYSSEIVLRRHRKILQDVRNRGIRRHRLKHLQAGGGGLNQRSCASLAVERGEFVGAKDKKF